MILLAGDLGIEIDFGRNQAGAILQRKEKGYWHDYLVDGEPMVNPFDSGNAGAWVVSAAACLKKVCVLHDLPVF